MGQGGGEERTVIGGASAVPPTEGLAPDLLSYLFEGPSAAASPGSALNPPSDHNLRAVLAAKLARVLPGLAAERFARVQALAVRALETLARDQAIQVREALAGAIKDVACAPHTVCLQLARDIEQTVAEPILRYCATLTDEDLRSILTGRPASWAVSAIARRDTVNEPVADAVYETGDAGATAALITNPGARIAAPTLELMVEDAVRQPDWQRPLATRSGLPAPLALRLARFVDQAVLECLTGRSDLDPATSLEIVAVARRRLDWLAATEPGESAEARARRLLRNRRLDDTAVGDALSWLQMEFVRIAISLLAAVPVDLVDAILRSKSPRAVTALAWRAGLTMRTAVQLQSGAAAIPPRLLLNARDGTGYPMTEIEMAWQLELFGIPVRSV